MLFGRKFPFLYYCIQNRMFQLTSLNQIVVGSFTLYEFLFNCAPASYFHSHQLNEQKNDLNRNELKKLGQVETETR